MLSVLRHRLQFVKAVASSDSVRERSLLARDDRADTEIRDRGRHEGS
jgi:hypothetical protein